MSSRTKRFDDDEDEDLGGPPVHPGIGISTTPQSSARDSDAADLDIDLGATHQDVRVAAAPDGPYGSRGSADPSMYQEDIVDAEDAQEGSVVPEQPKRRRMGPIVAFGAVFGVLVLGVGVAMVRVLVPSSAPSSQNMAAVPTTAVVAVAPQATTTAPVDVPPVAADSPLNAAPPTASATAPSAGPTGQASPGQSAPAAMQPPVVAVASPLDAQATQEMQRSIARIDSRIDGLTREVATLREQSSQLRVKSQTVNPAGQAAQPTQKAARSPASTESGQARSKPPREGGKTAAAKLPQSPQQQPIVVERPVAAQPVPVMPLLSGLSLRAVYPPTGADMQAWVMEGDALRVVARGSVIAGHRVIEVQPDKVLTDQGVIR